MPFGDDKHIKQLSRRELENLFRYMRNSRDNLNGIVRQQSRENIELRRKIGRQAKQLKEMQAALEQRNQGELKPRWRRALDRLEAENERLRKLLHDNGLEAD